MRIVATGMGWIEHTPGGLNRYFADYLEAMAASGHAVLGLMTANGEPIAAPSYMKDVMAEPGRYHAFSRARAFRSRVGEAIASFKPDVLNTHFALYASMIFRGSIPADVPIVTHFHGPWAHESRVEEEAEGGGSKLRYLLKKRIELTAYQRSDRFVVLSDYFRGILASDYGIRPDTIDIIPGAVDVGRFKPADDRDAVRASLGIDPETTVLFCARRLVKRMGLDGLIQAMSRVSRVRPKTVLYIAGAGPLRDRLDGMIGALRLESNVVMLGRVSNEDLVRWYQAADMSIVPTVTLEGFGLVTTEALACGTPVLGTPYGGTKEILERFSPSTLFADHSPEAMAAAIIQAASQERALPTREECRRHVLQHYTWEKAAASVTETFRRAIEERKELKKA